MEINKRKRILVTGGSGFIGTNFIRHTLHVKPDWDIVNLDSLTYAGNPHNFQDLKSDQSGRLHFVLGDVRNENLLSQLFSQNNFDSVVHFAAESHVDRSILGPKVFLETNVNGTFALLGESLRSWEDRKRPNDFRFLHVSTDEVYGSLGPHGYFTEETPYNPSSPYSASKAASDHFVKAYFHTYNLPAIITNCSNNYGPFQFPEKLLPLMILNIIEQKPLPIYGDGKNIRDWLFVLDHCEAILQVIERGVPGNTYNIGGNSERQNIDIVHLLCDLLDKRLGRSGKDTSRRLIRFVSDRPGHDRRYAIDATKIERELGWSPQFKFEEAINITLDWYLGNMAWVKSVRSGEYRKWIEDNYEDRENLSI
ncbi:MAG: dTDP-glucose 4,6-dehydratase [Candidatus Scalindua sp. AMX11]|nr:MAG: dTDP-glucose 4,6-dehydratase [Candidatus Scalindua sp.]RZV78345.1 MAG: dTDP-glucose 4,6-dehydratase [Candidatus Scalindua sp. SCAELEC01]TDE65105.1 MAG: dTDP-glucose 4,6-dehydratase [Candidatus Scalindua sp. AMX11]GJQ59546.1 MAG: dTDP-glucose 4,6-dehydratase [Candidatus Scalindua sp.]